MEATTNTGNLINKNLIDEIVQLQADSAKYKTLMKICEAFIANADRIPTTASIGLMLFQFKEIVNEIKNA